MSPPTAAGAAGAPAPAPDGPLAAAPDGPAAAVDTLLLDLDGVVYVGDRPVDGAAAAVAQARDLGLAVRFVTNNASRSPAAVAAALAGYGVPAGPADVVTAAQAAAGLLAARLPAGATVLVVGTDALREAVAAVGLTPVARDGDDPAAVVNGFSPQLAYPELAEAALAIRRGLPWVSTNLDATLPSPRGLLPGNGSVTALLATATGRQPEAAGKPEPPLLGEALRRSPGTRALMVGDRLDTDIAGARRAGLPGLLVLTGVSRPADVLLAPPESRPTYLAASLADLFRPHPGVADAPGPTRRCGAATATVADGVLTVDGDDAPALDALRAAAAAAWAARDRTGRPVRRVVGLSWPHPGGAGEALPGADTG